MVKLCICIDTDEKKDTAHYQTNLKAYEFQYNSLHRNLEVQAEIKVHADEVGHTHF